MKKMLPLLLVAGAAAACGKVDNDHDNAYTRQAAPVAVVAPVVPAGSYVTPSGAVVRQDGTYYYNEHGVVAVPGTVVEDHGYQHKHSEDALSDRTLGATRDIHGNPMTNKDSDHDGNYDYVPNYRTRAATYYYTY